MDYSYIQQEGHSHVSPSQSPGLSQGHPPNQYPFNPSQQQPYPSHLHIHPQPQDGFPIRFSPLVNSLQGQPGSAQNHLSSHLQDGLVCPRFPPSNSPAITTTSADNPLLAQRRHGFEHGMLGAAIGGGASDHHIEAVPLSSQHITPLRQHISTGHSPSPGIPSGAPFNLSTFNSYTVSTSQVSSVNTTASGSGSYTPVSPLPSTGRESNESTMLTKVPTPTTHPKKKRSGKGRKPKEREKEKEKEKDQPKQPKQPRQQAPPQIFQEPVLKVFKSCQTDPLFEQVRGFRGSPKRPAELPEGLAYKETVDEDGGSVGVMATRNFEEGEEFGPFTGEFMKDGLGCFDMATWELCVKETILYINGSKEQKNWMTQIHLACNTDEQNLEAFQSYGNILFRTKREIMSGTELKVFYGKDYSRHVGFKASLEDLEFDEDTGKFACMECTCRYTNPKSLLRHIKFEHDKENIPSPDTDPQSVAENVKDVKTENREDVNKDKIQSRVEERVEPEKVTRLRKRKPLLTQKIYTCKTCGKTFPSQGLLMEHGAFHRVTKKVQPVCEVCGLECSNDRELKKHKVSHDSNALVCPLCKKYFLKRHYLAAHLRNDHKMKRDTARAKMKEVLNPVSERALQEEELDEEGEKELVISEHTCEICELQFEDDDMLKEHITIHKSSLYSCVYCKKKYERKAHFVDHLTDGHDLLSKQFPTRKAKRKQISELVIPLDQKDKEEPFHEVLAKDMIGKKLRTSHAKFFRCKFCANPYTKFESVIEHMQLAHTSSGRFQCDFCPQTFTNETECILHKRLHTKDRPYKCASCPFSFASESALKNHQVEHSDARPEKCDICGKGFGSRKNVASHKRRLHKIQVKSLQCTFCDKLFANQQGLRRHEQRHKGIRPFVCMDCGRAFGTKYGLIHHSRTHTGERPYQCQLCKKRFTMNHHLARHLIRHELKSGDPEKSSQVVTSIGSASNGSNQDTTQPDLTTDSS